MHPRPHQGVCGDAIATLEGISREAVDALAVLSQQNADRAIKEGRFDKALIPVYNEEGSIALDYEEFPRSNTTMETLAALEPSFAKLADYPLDEAICPRFVWLSNEMLAGMAVDSFFGPNQWGGLPLFYRHRCARLMASAA